MAIHTAPFLFFFLPPVFLLYLIIPGVRCKNWFLAVASLLFYTCGQWQGIPCLLASVILTWLAGIWLPKAGGGRKKLLLAAVLIIHLLLLGSFKYWNFFTGMLNGLLGLRLPETSLILPVGISFFTFKAMSYAIDVYRDGNAAAKRFSDVLLYISFFPQITSGPISRFGSFAERLEKRPVDAERIARGLRRFIVGYAKKALISEAAAGIANSAFGMSAGDLDFRLAWLGAAAYTVQIYFDFSGYSDMSIGLASILGFDTPENFNYPYISASITEFWRRWHISLSSWFRDYLYIPLGGGRRGTVRKGVNKAIVFLLCGLWHGASWTFVIWGVWHGVFSALESYMPERVKVLGRTLPGKVLSHVYTLLVVCLGFVIFRASSLGEALMVYRAMFTGGTAAESGLALARISPAAWCAMGAGVVGSTPVGPWLKERASGGFWRPVSYIAAAGLFVLCLLCAAGSGFQPFIYTQF